MQGSYLASKLQSRVRIRTRAKQNFEFRVIECEEAFKELAQPWLGAMQGFQKADGGPFRWFGLRRASARNCFKARRAHNYKSEENCRGQGAEQGKTEQDVDEETQRRGTFLEEAERIISKPLPTRSMASKLRKTSLRAAS